MIIFFIFFFYGFNICNTNNNKEFYSISNNTNMHLDKKYNEIYPKKNVILGLIENYSFAKILPFFESLLKIKFEYCDIVMFVRYISPVIINYLSDIGVKVIMIPPIYKNVRAINIRWKMYADFLKDKINKYNLVFHTDIRDTIFQKDVFQYYKDYKPFLGVAIEDGTLENRINKLWITDYVGEERYKKISKERIICIGQLWGTIDKFLEFSNLFWIKLKESKAIEQGIYNYLIYNDKIFKDYIIKSDNYGPIMTIGLTEANKIHLDVKNNILNFNNEIAAVVHQYDRNKDIVKIVINKFCPELFIFYKNTNFILEKKNYTHNYEFNRTIQNYQNYQNNEINKYNKNIIYLLIMLQLLTIIILLKTRFHSFAKL